MISQRTIPLLEDIFAACAPRIGADLPGYRNYCYRMLHFCLFGRFNNHHTSLFRQRE